LNFQPIMSEMPRLGHMRLLRFYRNGLNGLIG